MDFISVFEFVAVSSDPVDEWIKPGKQLRL